MTLYDYELQAWVVGGRISGSHAYEGWWVWEARELEGLDPLGCYHKHLEESWQRLNFIRVRLGDKVWSELEREFVESLRFASKLDPTLNKEKP